MVLGGRRDWLGRILEVRVRVVLLGQLLTAGNVPAQTSAAAPADSALLGGLDAMIEAAVVHGDTAALDTLYAEDLRFTHGTGEIDDRRTWLRVAAAPRRAFRGRTVDSVLVDLHGPVALTSGRLTVMPSDERPYVVRYVRLYAKQAGRWVLKSHRSVEVHSLPASSGSP